MDSEPRGRPSRASSTSSLEVRCGCQYYQTDSLLPERRAMFSRPPSRTMQQPAAVSCSEHEYEPIAPPSPSPQPMSAPVVRITETDMVPVADSDDSIDDRGGRVPRLVLDGDVVLPLDGKIEDVAMEGRELGGTGDTSEEQDVLHPPSPETIQQFQERLEERFLSAATPCTESRTDAEINTSQVDSSTLEELPLRRGARNLHQRLRTQAGKIRFRLRGIQRPTFSLPGREKKIEKPHSASSGRSDISRSEKRPSRMDRIRSSLPDRPRFSLPDRPKFTLPEKAKFHLPERPKFHLPDRPKFNIKKPNIRLPTALTRKRRSSLKGADVQTRSTDSTVGSSRRNIFDFSTYPRIFDKKSKNRGEYATSSPKDSRAQSAESATFPRARKRSSLTARWAQRFGDAAYVEDERVTAEKAQAWRRPSLEEAKLTRGDEEIVLKAPSMPWEEARKRLEEATKRQPEPEEEEEEEEVDLRYMDYEPESPETSERQAQPTSQEESRTEEEFTSERDQVEVDPRLFADRLEPEIEREIEEQIRGQEELPVERLEEPVEEVHEQVEEPPRPPKRMPKEQRMRKAQQRRWQEEEERAQEMAKEGLDEQVYDDRYEGSFQAVDPRRFGMRKTPSGEEEVEIEGEVEIEEPDVSAASDKEQQQSSGSSCDRRRRGIIEEVDSDEFYLRESGISQDDLGKYLSSDLREALGVNVNALADDSVLPMMGQPPQRPARTRSIRKRKDGSEESFDVAPPARPKRERGRRSQESDDVFFDRASSSSKHRVVYQTEGSPAEFPTEEPLDDIVVVKPARRKSRSSSQSQIPQESFDATPPQPEVVALPPAVPSRRKRPCREVFGDRNGHSTPICNGHREWREEMRHSAPPRSPSMIADDLRQTQDDDIEDLARRLRDEDYVEPVPMPPKRRSRSRTTSFAQDEDRTSHGAESLPEAGYIEDDIPRDETDSARDLSGYAIVEKREKPPRPPPPRRRRDKFSTTPRPTPPRRPQRAYSTLGPARYREAESILSESTSVTIEPETTPYVEIDSDDGEHKDLRSGEVLSRMQGRPLPAPPRPPRSKKEPFERLTRPTEELMEISAGTQTDPLPDDMVIEEEVTQAKLIVAPSRSGSQIMVSTERIPSPSRMITPPVPPLPGSQFARRDEEMRESGAASTVMESALPSQVHERIMEQQVQLLRSALLADDTLRIGSLEVGDLKVDRLSVSQLDAHKIVASEVEAHKIVASEMEAQKIVATELEAKRIVASEVDSLVITASEVKGIEPPQPVEEFSPSIIKELIAIRSHLETVALSQAQQEMRLELEASEKERARIDIPATDETKTLMAKSEVDRGIAKDERPTKLDADDGEDSKATPKRDTAEVKKKEITATHTLTIAQDISEESLRALESYPYHTSGPKDAIETHAVLPVTDATSFEPIVSEVASKRLPEPPVESELSSELSSEPPMSESVKPSPEPTPDALSVDRDEYVDSVPSEVSERTRKEDTPESAASERRIGRKSRSRSPSPVRGAVRQTASPVRSLPPVISVTPDISPDVTVGRISSSEPQRAIISYSRDVESSQRESQREITPSPSPTPSVTFPIGGTHFVAFPVSQVPPQFYSQIEPSSATPDATPTATRVEPEPSIASTTHQLIRVLRQAGAKAMRHFVEYLTARVGTDDSREKIRQIELAICALLLLIAGLLILFLCSSRTITHHHHWDYFNPPR